MMNENCCRFCRLLCQPDLYCMHLSEDGLCSSGVAITYPIKICLSRASVAKTKLWSALSALLRQRWWVFTRTHTNTHQWMQPHRLYLPQKEMGGKKQRHRHREKVWFKKKYLFFLLSYLAENQSINKFFLHLGELVLLSFLIIFCEVAKRDLTKHRYCSHRQQRMKIGSWL